MCAAPGRIKGHSEKGKSSAKKAQRSVKRYFKGKYTLYSMVMKLKSLTDSREMRRNFAIRFKLFNYVILWISEETLTLSEII